jgi:hypothetical protein
MNTKLTFVRTPAEAGVDPGWDVHTDTGIYTGLSIQDATSYGGGFGLNEYGGSIEKGDFWMRTISMHASKQAAKMAATRYWRAQNQ